MSHYPLHGEVGHYHKFADFTVCPSDLCFFIKAMSRPNFFNSKVVYHDNSREYNIDARGRDVASILRACEADDVEAVQEIVTTDNKTLPFLVPQKLTELGTYTLSEFEEKYREAVRGGANILAPFLKKYRDLQVLDFGGRNKKETFEVLKAYFGDEINYGYTNFAAYY